MFGDGADEAEREPRDRSSVVAGLRRKLAGLSGAPRWVAAGGESEAPPARGAHRPVESAVLAVPDPVAQVLPQGGVPPGSVVRLASTAPGRGGTTSLLLTLLAAPPGAWAAVVGLPGLGVLAAAELGVDLDRLGLIPDPGPDVLQVLSVLADGVDVIATAAPATVPPARARVLAGRLRQQGAVLLVVGHWPGADLTMTVTDVRWSGIGQGYGRLRDREIDVEIGGRRLGGGARTTLMLRSARTAVRVEHGQGPTRADGDDRLDRYSPAYPA